MSQHTNNPSMKSSTLIMNSSSSRMSSFDSLLNSQELETKASRNQFYILELGLYALFVSFIFVMMLLPNQAIAIIELFPNTQLVDPVGFMLWIKMSLFISSLVPLFWALHYSSKRLQGRLVARKSKI